MLVAVNYRVSVPGTGKLGMKDRRNGAAGSKYLLGFKVVVGGNRKREMVVRRPPGASEKSCHAGGGLGVVEKANRWKAIPARCASLGSSADFSRICRFAHRTKVYLTP